MCYKLKLIYNYLTRLEIIILKIQNIYVEWFMFTEHCSDICNVFLTERLHSRSF